MREVRSPRPRLGCCVLCQDKPAARCSDKLDPAESRTRFPFCRKKADVMTPLRPAMRLPAAVAFMLGIWGVQPSEWTLAAQSASQPDTGKSDESGTAVVVNGERITDNEIEQRARFLALSADLGAQVKENFQALVKSGGTED